MLDFLYILPNAPVHAQDLALHQPRQRQVVEHLVDLLEHRVRVVDVLPQPVGALLAQPEYPVHAHVVVAAPQQADRVLVFELQREKQTNDLNQTPTSRLLNPKSQ